MKGISAMNAHEHLTHHRFSIGTSQIEVREPTPSVYARTVCRNRVVGRMTSGNAVKYVQP
jgi:hypothetical protein